MAQRRPRLSLREAELYAATQGNPALRRLLQQVMHGLERAGEAVGVDVLAVQSVEGNIAPPLPAKLQVTGGGGKFRVVITNPLPGVDRRAGAIRNEPAFDRFGTTEVRRSRKADLTTKFDARGARRVIHELQSAKNTAFDAAGEVQTLGPSEAKNYELTEPGVSRYWRIRSRYENSDWNQWTPYTVASGGVVAVSSGLENLGNIADSSTRKGMTAANTSYRPLSNPLTAADVGGTPRATITTFTMRIAGVGDVVVSGSSVDASSGDFGKTAFIYYDDPSFAGGSVVFNVTFTREVALNGAGRFFVGSIALPKSGGSPTVGNDDGGAGAQIARSLFLFPQSYTAAGWVNPANAIDGDTATFANATTAGADLTFEAHTFPLFPLGGTSLLLEIRHEITAVAGGTAYVEYSLDGGSTWIVARTVTVADAGEVRTEVTLNTAQLTDRVRARVRIPGSAVSGSASAAAGTAANDASIGTRAWTNPANAQGATNGSYATNTGQALNTTEQSNYLLLTSFGFAVPGGATIVGISAAVVRKGSYFAEDVDNPGVFAYVEDLSVRLVKAGAVTGNNKAAAGFWASFDETKSYGGSTDLWGAALTDADVNAANFGIALAVVKERGTLGSGPVTASVDSVTLTVYYTTAGAASSSARIYAVRQKVTL